MGKIDPMIFNRAVFRALKPGGVFLVVDHTAESGSGMRDTDTLHRIDPAIVKKQIEDAGFVFEGESNVLRNPADDLKKLVFDEIDPQPHRSVHLQVPQTQEVGQETSGRCNRPAWTKPLSIMACCCRKGGGLVILPGEQSMASRPMPPTRAQSRRLQGAGRPAQSSHCPRCGR